LDIDDVVQKREFIEYGPVPTQEYATTYVDKVEKRIKQLAVEGKAFLPLRSTFFSFPRKAFIGWDMLNACVGTPIANKSYSASLSMSASSALTRSTVIPCALPLMNLIGVMFSLSPFYYVILASLVAFMSLRLVQNRFVTLGTKSSDTEQTLKLGKTFSRDFMFMVIVQTTNLILSSFLKYHSLFLL
jgi:hypothetical protein